MYILHRQNEQMPKITEYYNNFELVKVITDIQYFISNDISSQYIFICKDRQYCEELKSPTRIECLIVLYHIQEFLLKVYIPIIPFKCSDIFQHISKSLYKKLSINEKYISKEEEIVSQEPVDMVSKLGWQNLQNNWENIYEKQRWLCILNIRSYFLQIIEQLRNTKIITSSNNVKQILTIVSSTDIYNKKKIIEFFQFEFLLYVFSVPCIELRESMPHSSSPSSLIQEGILHKAIIDQKAVCKNDSIHNTIKDIKIQMELLNYSNESKKCERCWRPFIESKDFDTVIGSTVYALFGKNTLCDRCITVLSNLADRDRDLQ